MYDLKNISKNLRELRKQRGYTQERLAAEIGMNIETYKSIEIGRRAGSIDSLCLIAEYFDVSLEYFLDREKTQEEKLNIDYRKLSPEKQKILFKMVEALIEVLKCTELGC